MLLKFTNASKMKHQFHLGAFLILHWSFTFKKQIIKFNISYCNKDIKQQIFSFHTFYCLFSSCILIFFKYHTTCLTKIGLNYNIYLWRYEGKKIHWSRGCQQIYQIDHQVQNLWLKLNCTKTWQSYMTHNQI